jgi:hypothetical protein
MVDDGGATWAGGRPAGGTRRQALVEGSVRGASRLGRSIAAPPIVTSVGSIWDIALLAEVGDSEASQLRCVIEAAELGTDLFP